MKFETIRILPRSAKLILLELFGSDRPLSLSELDERISLSTRTISFGMSKLKTLGLVKRLSLFKDMRTCSFYMPKAIRSWIQSITGNDLAQSLKLNIITT